MFERNSGCYSLAEQAKLAHSCAAVCGLGGGGGYVAEILARTGVGRLILIDGDVFEDSNRNRQIGALRSTLGRLKAECMAERLLDVNSGLSVKAHPVFITEDNAPELLKGADVVCDCVDGHANKLRLNGICRSLGLPYSTGGLSGKRLHAAMLTDYEAGRLLYAPQGRGKSEQGPAPTANPASILICAGLQAQETLDFLLGREQPTLNKDIFLNQQTYSLVVTETGWKKDISGERDA